MYNSNSNWLRINMKDTVGLDDSWAPQKLSLYSAVWVMSIIGGSEGSTLQTVNLAFEMFMSLIKIYSPGPLCV